MKNSSENSWIVGMLVAIILIFLGLFLFQSAWLKGIQYLLNSSQSNGLPVSSTPISNFSIPTTAPAAAVGVETIYGNYAITVTRVVYPADEIVGDAAKFSTLKSGEHYLLVNITVRCLSTAETTCRLTEFDFGVESKGGGDYPAELSGNFSDLNGLFEGGEIKPGRSLSGAVIFVIQPGEHGLNLVYPRMYGLGGELRFILTQ